jgi:hypothetical protein
MDFMKQFFTTACPLRLIALSVFLYQGCTSDPKIQEAITKDQPTEVANDEQIAQEFIDRLLNENNDFIESDRTYFTSLPTKTEPGSTVEAAVAVGLVRYILAESETRQSSSEDQLLLDDKRAAKDADPTSLEALSLERSLDFAEVVRSNPKLSQLSFFKMCLKALKGSNDSTMFTKAVNDSIAQSLEVWKQNHRSVDAAKISALTPDRTDFHGADLRIGDNILLEAQALSDNRRYAEAISKAKLIGDDSPLRQNARMKVVEFSDLAVQELRQKAAQAFQNALPVSDPKTRSMYLAEAKSYLENALQQFPEAPSDQLSTVRENLAVISRDLEKLDDPTQK